MVDATRVTPFSPGQDGSAPAAGAATAVFVSSRTSTWRLRSGLRGCRLRARSDPGMDHGLAAESSKPDARHRDRHRGRACRSSHSRSRSRNRGPFKLARFVGGGHANGNFPPAARMSPAGPYRAASALLPAQSPSAAPTSICWRWSGSRRNGKASPIRLRFCHTRSARTLLWRSISPVASMPC